MATLTTLESFTGGADGGSPGYGALLMDADGNLFGTTLSGGTAGGGTVFELVNTGSGYSFQTLASFDPTDAAGGNTPFAGLTMDASGNLFGVTQAGGPAGAGTVFELVNTGSGYSLQTLAAFSGGASGAYPAGTLLADASGDLFGTTQSGGANGQGTVFEMVHAGSGYSLQTLYSFDYADGAAPTGPLVADAHGDLFGTTLQGGAGGQGTVFELVNTGAGYSLRTLASFDGANGSFLYAGLTADAQGDLFGTTYSGGAGGYGTVYELVNTGSGFSFQTLAVLDYATTGGYAIGGLTLDAQGDIFGTALAGGAGGFGTVFELVHGASGYTLQTLFAFGGADGGLPEASLVLDAGGNLYGTTAGGGADGAGTVFEIAGAAPSNEQALDTAAPAQPGVPADAAVSDGWVNAAHDTAGQTIGGTAEAGSAVAVYDNGTHVATVTADDAGAWSYRVGVLADGAHSFAVTATDAAGNTSVMSDALGFTVDATPPPAPTGLADSAIARGYVNGAHDTSGQTLTGKAEAGALVTVYDNGVKLGTATADGSTGAWSFTLGGLADGAQSLTATATDAAGNTGPASAALAFTVDATAPVPLVTNVTDAGKGQSTVSGTSEAGSSVTLFDSGQQVGVATAGADGTWSVTLKLTGGSTHQFTETAVDLAGNTGGSAGSAYWANPANKSFVGASGNDVFIGGKGDTLTGGGGHNHFVFNAGFGKQTVTNFTGGADQLWFDHALFGNLAQVLAHAQQSGADALIADTAGDQLLLQGVQCATLQAADFHFF